MGYHDFPSKIFCIIVPRNFLGEPFCDVFQKIPVAKKLKEKWGGGGVSRISVEKIFSQCRKFS